jgi:NitT/TauT family transport system substrate-binding protein
LRLKRWQIGPLLAAFVILISCASLSSGPAQAASSQRPTQATDNVTFALAVNPPDQGQIFAYVPKGAGFFSKEHLNVSFQPNAGGGAALKQLAAGNAQFAISSPENLLNGLAGGMDLRAVATIITKSIYSVAVKKGSPIKKISQLKGKNVGVSALTSGSYPTAEAALLENHINPQSDVHIIVVGNGGPALNALQSGQVDAIVTTDTQFAIFKALGGSFTLLPRPAIAKLPGDQILVQTSYLQSHPGIVARFARAVMEGTVFALANPKRATQFYIKQYPEVANTLTVKQNEAIMLARLNNLKLIKQQKHRWGYIPLSLYEQVQAEDLQLGTVQHEQNLLRIMTNQLNKAINKFNPGAIAKQAKGSK